MAVIIFFAPLYKEYLLLISFTIFFSELISPKRSWRLLLFMLPLLIHSVFPLFIINFLFYKNPAFSSPLEKYISHIKTLNINFRLHAFNHLIFTIPPIISLLGIVAIYRNIFSKRLLGHKVNLAVILFLSILYTSLFIPPDVSSIPWTNFLSFLLVLCISLSAFQINRILAVWFFIAWLPYLLIYYVEVHLVYAIGPLAIILLWNIGQFLKCLSNNKKKETLSLAPLLLIILLCVAFVDQALNPIAAYRTFKATNDAAINISHHLSRNDLEGKQNILI